MEKTTMRHITEIQIRFKDIDKLGHVNNANHFTYLELARMKFFDDVIKVKIDWIKTGLILAKVVIDYKQPIFIEDKLIVRTKISRLGNKSFELAHHIIRIVDDKEIIAAEGLSVVVCFDYERNQTIAIPEEWIRKIELYDKSV